MENCIRANLDTPIDIAGLQRFAGDIELGALAPLPPVADSRPERVAVIDNACPHAGGNLSGGEVFENVVTCPWHHWEIDLSTGQCVHKQLARIGRYDAEIRDGAVWMRWRVTYRHPDVPDVVLEGESTAHYDGDRIARLEDRMEEASVKQALEILGANADRLKPVGG